MANRNVELAVPLLLWPVNCIKIGGHVALLSGPTVYSPILWQSLKAVLHDHVIFAANANAGLASAVYGATFYNV